MRELPNIKSIHIYTDSHTHASAGANYLLSKLPARKQHICVNMDDVHAAHTYIYARSRQSNHNNKHSTVWSRCIAIAYTCLLLVRGEEIHVCVRLSLPFRETARAMWCVYLLQVISWVIHIWKVLTAHRERESSQAFAIYVLFQWDSNYLYVL